MTTTPDIVQRDRNNATALAKAIVASAGTPIYNSCDAGALRIQIAAAILDSVTAARAESAPEIERLRKDNAAMVAAMRQGYIEGRREVDAELHTNGYDSIRFADTRHGWIYTWKPFEKWIEPIGEMVECDSKVETLAKDRNAAEIRAAAWEAEARAWKEAERQGLVTNPFATGNGNTASYYAWNRLVDARAHTDAVMKAQARTALTENPDA